MKRKRMLLAIIMLLIVSLIPVPVSAVGKVKMTAYKVIKTGNTIYCGGHTGLYEIKLENDTVVGIKRLKKFGVDSGCGYLKKRGKYLYYNEEGPGGAGIVGRINIKTGKRKRIVRIYGTKFVIKRNKVYYSKVSFPDFKKLNYVATLKGKSAKKTNIKIALKRKASNVKGFAFISDFGDEDDDSDEDARVKEYLRTPKEMIFLGEEILE